MATKYFNGNAIANYKVVKINPPSVSALASKTIKIGLGDRLLTFTGYSAAAIVAAWNAQSDVQLSDLTASTSGDAVLFTHKRLGEDFELTVLVDDEEIIHVNTIQTLVFPTAPANATFTLRFDGQTTGTITYSSTAATFASNITTALNALSNIAPGDVEVTYTDSHNLSIEFKGQYLGVNVPLLTVPAFAVTGTGDTGGVTVTQGATGTTGTNEVQTLSIPSYDETGTPIGRFSFAIGYQPVGSNPTSGVVGFTANTGGGGTSGENNVGWALGDFTIPYNAVAADIAAIFTQLRDDAGYDDDDFVVTVNNAHPTDKSLANTSGSGTPFAGVFFTGPLVAAQPELFGESAGNWYGYTVTTTLAGPLGTSAQYAAAIAAGYSTDDEYGAQGNITGGTWDLLTPEGWLEDIPFDVSVAAFTTLLDAQLGGAQTTVSGTDFPDGTITIEFTGTLAKTNLTQMTTRSNFEMYDDTTEVVRTAASLTNPQNVWDLTICPGYGTLAVDTSANNSYNWFYIDIYVPDCETFIRIKFRWPNCTPKRIELAINEAFGRDVCKVIQTVHSQESSSLNLAYGVIDPYPCQPASFFYDQYRIIFFNDLAEADSIDNIVITVPGGGTNNNPANWMTFNNSADYDDFDKESNKTYNLFVAAYVANNPIHLFSIERGDPLTTSLSYRYKLLTFYGEDGTLVTSRAFRSNNAPDMKIQFHWMRFNTDSDKYLTGQVSANSELTTSTVLASSAILDWDCSASQIKAALAAMRVNNVASDLFGSSDIQVTGSLYNSWLSEWATDEPNDSDNYNDLKITFINHHANLPYDDFNYHLSCTIIWPYEEDENADLNPPMMWRDVINRPVPPFRNQRYSYSVEEAGNYYIGFEGQTALVTEASTAAQIQTALNDLSTLGHFNTSGVIPEKWMRSVTVYGDTLLTGIEIEFTGYGFQNEAPDSMPTLSSSGSSLVVVTTTVPGVEAVGESFTVAIPRTPTSGTFQLKCGSFTTTDLAYNASAATVEAALEAMDASFNNKVTVTGGPLPATLTVTIDPTLGNVTNFVYQENKLPSSIVVTKTSIGGETGTVVVSDEEPGCGPSYYDCPYNWSDFTMPSSGDQIIIETARSPILYGLNQYSLFTTKALGSSTLFKLTNRRMTFQVGQVVTFSTFNGGTAPTGLTSGDLYTIATLNEDRTFTLLDDTDTLVSVSDDGNGDYGIFIDDLTLNIYSQYGGGSFGLPPYRSNNTLEYLAQYFKAGFTAITIGIGEGDGLSLGRFHTLLTAPTIEVHNTGSSSLPNTPSVNFILNNSSIDLTQHNGDVGVAFYSSETSLLNTIEAENGSLRIGTVTVSTHVHTTPNVYFKSLLLDCEIVTVS